MSKRTEMGLAAICLIGLAMVINGMLTYRGGVDAEYAMQFASESMPSETAFRGAHSDQLSGMFLVISGTIMVFAGVGLAIYLQRTAIAIGWSNFRERMSSWRRRVKRTFGRRGERRRKLDALIALQTEETHLRIRREQRDLGFYAEIDGLVGQFGTCDQREIPEISLPPQDL